MQLLKKLTFTVRQSTTSQTSFHGCVTKTSACTTKTPTRIIRNPQLHVVEKKVIEFYFELTISTTRGKKFSVKIKCE